MCVVFLCWAKRHFLTCQWINSSGNWFSIENAWWWWIWSSVKWIMNFLSRFLSLMWKSLYDMLEPYPQFICQICLRFSSSKWISFSQDLLWIRSLFVSLVAKKNALKPYLKWKPWPFTGLVIDWRYNILKLLIAWNDTELIRLLSQKQANNYIRMDGSRTGSKQLNVMSKNILCIWTWLN